MCTHFGEGRPAAPDQSRLPITFVCGCCFLLRVDVLRQVGGFDESFFTYGEDLELSIRLARGGHKMVYEPSATLLHRITRGAPATARQIQLRDKNRRRIARRHYGAWGRLRFAAWFYPTRAIHLVRHVAKGDWAKARAQIDGAVGPLG
jgi:GT2 family glycosyltransferase